MGLIVAGPVIAYMSSVAPAAAINGAFWLSNPTNQQFLVGVGGLAASLLDPNPNADYPGDFDDVAKGTKLLFKSVATEKFILNTSKFDYFFGKVVSNKHNTDRSLQIMKDLASFGVKEDNAGKTWLAKAFSTGLKGDIVRQVADKWGTSITRSVFVKRGKETIGEIEISYFYKGGDMSLTPEISSIIPKIYRRK